MLNYYGADCCSNEIGASANDMRLPLTRFFDETEADATERTCVLDFSSIDVSQSLTLSLPTEYACFLQLSSDTLTRLMQSVRRSITVLQSPAAQFLLANKSDEQRSEMATVFA